MFDASGPGSRWFGCFNSLLEGKEYFACDKFTIGDLCVYEVISAAVELGGVSLDAFPNLKAFYERIGARPNIAAYVAKRG